MTHKTDITLKTANLNDYMKNNKEAGFMVPKDLVFSYLNDDEWFLSYKGTVLKGNGLTGNGIARVAKAMVEGLPK